MWWKVAGGYEMNKEEVALAGWIGLFIVGLFTGIVLTDVWNFDYLVKEIEIPEKFTTAYLNGKAVGFNEGSKFSYDFCLQGKFCEEKKEKELIKIDSSNRTISIDTNAIFTINPCVLSRIGFYETHRILSEDENGWLMTIDTNQLHSSNLFWISKSHYLIEENTEDKLVFNTPQCLQERMK